MPFSPGCQRDDKFIKTVSHLLNTDVVITEKLDGGNVCLESEDVFARSHEGPPSHPSFGELKALHSTLKYQIPQDVQVFGEWCLAIKSLEYTEVLPAYLFIIAIRENGVWKSWQDTQNWASDLCLPTVPQIALTRFSSVQDMKCQVEAITGTASAYGPEKEGVVVRRIDEITDEDFEVSVAKWVRKDHVQDDEHWSNGLYRRHKIQR